MQRDVRKVSWDGERVVVKWEIPKPGGIDKYQLSCVDAPARELTDALNAMRRHVADICELPAKYGDSLEIRGASYSYGGDDRVMGATITALKKLTTANAPLVINTPHLPEHPYSKGGEEMALPLPPAAAEALHELARQALRYVEGHRVQRDLFAKPADVDADGVLVES
jgi:hypothetical protein